jgi:hypothetical protein
MRAVPKPGPGGFRRPGRVLFNGGLTQPCALLRSPYSIQIPS